MSQTPPGSMATNAVATSRVPVAELYVAWGLDANTAISNWSSQADNETSRLLEVTWSRQLDIDAPLSLGRGPAAEMSVTLSNYDQRYSPFNSSGALYADLSAAATLPDGVTTIRYPRLFMVPIRLRVGFGSDLIDAFYGYIDEPGETYGVSGDRVTFRCMDRALKLIQARKSSRLRKNWRSEEWLDYIVAQLGGIAVTPANLDNGFFAIPYAWLDDEVLWSEVQNVAGAEGGYAFFDETGAFLFRNAAWWNQYSDSTSSQFEFTTARFSDLNPIYDYRNVATGAVVEYQTRSYGGEQVIWQRNETIAIPPGGETVEARFELPAEYVYPPTLETDWKPVNAGGVAMNDDVGVTLEDTYAQRTTLTFTNTSHETAFVTNMKLRGRALVGRPSEQVERNVAVPLVPESKTRLSNNPYVQTREQAEMLADLAVERMQYPRLTYQLTGVPAIPWLQLGDKITITASQPITTSRTAIITKLAFTWRPDAPFTMTIDAVDTAALYTYAALFVIGTSEYGGEYIFR